MKEACSLYKRACIGDIPLWRRAGVALMGVLLASSGAFAQVAPTAVPIPCNPCATDIFFSQTPGSASSVTPGGFDDILQRQVDLLIEQRQQREIFNWQSFDIGSEKEVYFKQRVLDADGSPTLVKDPTKVAINMVREGDNPTEILGLLRADGQVYIINPNGVLFREGSQVDVNTLLVSGIDFGPSIDTIQNTDDIFSLSRVAGNTGLFIAAEEGAGNVDIEAGAVLRVQENGRLVVVGKSVSNAGALSASGAGGQVMLVASGEPGGSPEDGRVWLFTDAPTGDDDALTEAVRGLDVALGTSAAGQSGGTVTNSGQISVGPGNVTLAGALVNQNGVVRATTAVNANGSIRLLARGNATTPNGTGEEPAQAQPDFGTVNFGAESVTAVELTDDAAQQTLTDAQRFPSPLVFTNAREVTVGNGATVKATSGRIEMRAQRPEAESGNAADPDTVGVRIGENVTLDASGVDSLALPMNANELTFELRGNELADVPEQRDGALRGEIVTIDARKPPPDIANFDAAFANRERTLAERYLVGGEVVLDAFAGEVLVGEGSLIDVSGGFVQYAPGEVRTSMVFTPNGLVGIQDARPDQVFLSVNGSLEVNYDRWGVTDSFVLIPEQASGGGREPGYVEGKDAGTIAISGAQALVSGTLRAATRSGLYQRVVDPADAIFVDPQSGEITRTVFATGAKTTFDAAELAGLSRRRLAANLDDTGYLRPFDELPAGGRVELGSTLQQGSITLERAGNMLALSVAVNGTVASAALDGFSELALTGNAFELPAGTAVDLGPAGALSVTAADSARFAGRLSAPGGSLAVLVNPAVSSAQLPGNFDQFNDAVGGLVVAPGAVIDLAGRLVVDPNPLYTPFPSAPVVSDGGVFLSSVVAEGPLTETAGAQFAPGSEVLVDGGAYRAADSRLVAGRGGVVGLDVSTFTVLGADDLSAIAQAEASLQGGLSGRTFSGAGVTVTSQGAGLALKAPELSLAGGVGPQVDVLSLLEGARGFHDLSFTSNERVMVLPEALVLSVAPQQVEYIGRADTLQSGFAGTAGSALSNRAARLIAPDPALVTPSSLWLASRQTAFDETAAVATAAPNAAMVLGRGSALQVTPGGAIGLRNEGSLVVSGTLTARGGTVSLEAAPMFANEIGDVLAQNIEAYGYNDTLGLFVTDSAAIDVRGVIATESLNYAATPGADVRRQILHGGEVFLRADTGIIAGASGARLRLDGAQGTVPGGSDEFGGLGLTGPRTTQVATDAGTLHLDSGLGMAFASEVSAAAATALGARGGAIEINLDAGLRPISASSQGPPAAFSAFDLPDPALEAPGVSGYQTEQLVLDVQSVFNAPLSSAVAGDSLEAAYNVARVDVGRFLANGGADVGLRVRPNEDSANVPSLDILVDGGVGFDPIFSEAVVRLAADLELSVPGRLTIDTPIVEVAGGDASLSAGYVSIGSSEDAFVISDSTFAVDSFSDPSVEYMSPTAGAAGSLRVRGTQVDLTGQLATRGLGDAALVEISSAGDLRLVGVRRKFLIAANQAVGNSRTPQGALATRANLNLLGERIYPTSLTAYDVVSLGENRLVGFAADSAPGRVVAGNSSPIRGGTRRTAVASELPFSVGGSISVTADNIYQAGALFAPLGSIRLDAQDSLVLESGSLTSVASAGLSMPFGKTELGEYVVSFLDQSVVDDSNRTSIIYSVAPDPILGFEKRFPEKSLALTVADAQADIDLAPGAVLDVSGGGNIFATEFSSGPRGTVDLLEPASAAGAFAVLPMTGTQTSVFEPVDSPGFPYAPGTFVQINNSGRPDLPGGRYAVLPPRFALVEGAFLITPEAGSAPAFNSSTQPFTGADGRAVAFGKFVSPGEGSALTLATRFSIESSAEVANRAEYLRTDANDFFAAQAATLGAEPGFLPRDAGELLINATATLGLGAELVAAPAGGLGSRVDILANRLAVGTAPEAGAVLLAPDAIAALNADSLLLGARRARSGDLLTLSEVRADRVTVQTGTTVEAAELMLAATEAVEFAAGSEVRATGVSDDRLRIDVDSALAEPQSVAFAMVSNREVVEVTRAPTGNARVVAEGTLSASGSIVLEAPGRLEVDLSQVALAEGGQLALGGDALLIGAARDGISGINLANLDPAVGLDTVRLRSEQAIMLDTPFDLAVETLALDSPGLGRGALAETAVIRVTQLSLANSSGQEAPDAADYAHGLSLSGRELVLEGTGAEGFSLDGFATLALDFGSLLSTASSELVLNAATDNAVSVGASRIAARALSTLSLTSPNALHVAGGSLLAPALDESTRLDVLGGGVQILGDSVSVATEVLAPGGDIELRARSLTGGTLTLNDGALLNVSGLSGLERGGIDVGTAGGEVRLIAATGDIELNAAGPAGVQIDVSGGIGADVSGAGGRLSLLAPSGDLNLIDPTALSLSGSADASAAQAGFALQTGGLLGAGLSDFLVTLGQGSAGGESFGASFRLEFTGGTAGALASVDLTPGDDIRSGRIEIVSDAAPIMLASRLDASGNRAGSVLLAANADVALLDGAEIDARATGGVAKAEQLQAVAGQFDAGYNGGQFEVVALGGTARSDAGATVHVGGTRVDLDGMLVPDASGRVRVVQVASDGEIDVSALDGTYTGVGEFVALDRVTRDAGDLQSDQIGVLAAANVSFAADAGPAATFLVAPQAAANTPTLTAAADFDFTHTGGFTLNASDLLPLFDNGIEAGRITVRATEDLTLSGDLIDGRIGDSSEALLVNQTVSEISDFDRSWGIALVAGANLGGADRLVTSNARADVLALNGSVATGTGDLELFSAGDIRVGAGAYLATTGRHSAPSAPGATDGYLGTYGKEDGDFTLATRLSGVSLPEQGGDIRIRALGALEFADLPTSSAGLREFLVVVGAQDSARVAQRKQRNSDTLIGSNLTDLPRAWGFALDNIPGGMVTALGGGAVGVDVGTTVRQGSFVAASAGRQTGEVGPLGASDNAGTLEFGLAVPYMVETEPGVYRAVVSDVVEMQNAGVVSIRSGELQDVDLTVAQGEGEVIVRDAASTGPNPTASGLRLLLGQADISVQTGGNIDLAAVADPTTLAVPDSAVPYYLRGSASDENKSASAVDVYAITRFLSMAETASLSVLSATGDLTMARNAGAEPDSGGGLLATVDYLLPGDTSLVTIAGDIDLADSVTRFVPSAQTNARIVAGSSLFGQGATQTEIGYFEADFARLYVDTLGQPAAFRLVSDGARQQTYSRAEPGVGPAGQVNVGIDPEFKPSTPMLENDQTPLVLAAEAGSVSRLKVESAEAVAITAGQDVRNIRLVASNLSNEAMSSVTAGRDIFQPTLREQLTFEDNGTPNRPRKFGAILTGSVSSQLGFLVDGGGDFLVTSGRDIDLGVSQGIVSRGGVVDTRLEPLDGAALTVLAGATGRATPIDLLTTFTSPERLNAAIADALQGSESSAALAELEAAAQPSYVTPTQAALSDYLATLERAGVSAPSDADDLTRFAALPEAYQVVFATKTYFSITETAGRAGQLVFADAASSALFPGSGAGDFSSPLSTLQTQDDGAINLAAPYGSANTGLTGLAGVSDDFKSDRDLGIIAFRAGDANAYVADDYFVNSTRLFAQGGGNVLVYARNGNIDAGRGAKSVADVAEPVPEYDRFGNFSDRPPLEVAGSGIRSTAPPGVPPGDALLFAPGGVINAGDAGIGSDGGLVAVANQIIGADNISVSGPSSVTTSNSSVSVDAGSADVAAAATRAAGAAAEQAVQQAAENKAAEQAAQKPKLARVDVDVLSFGE